MGKDVQSRKGNLLNKKAFTLIELLAVIVILAIIALIAVPIILNIIGDSKEESNKRSIDGYADAVKNAISKQQLQKPNEVVKGSFTSTNGGKTLTGTTTLTVEYDGNVECSDIQIYEDGTFYLGGCKVNNETVNYKYGEERSYVDTVGVSVNVPTGLTPVLYDGENWKIAAKSSKWFDYGNQEWANAVILNENVSSEPDTIIYPDGNNVNIKAMFVYIPRYSYTIGNTYGVQMDGGSQISKNSPGAIDIKFIDVDTKDNGTAAYTGDIASEWYTHPAFTFGTDELEGIWVGKFELSHTTIKSLGCSNEECTDASGLRILPNVKSLIKNNVSNFYFAIRSMEFASNGFRLDSNSVDTHMMKNSEWGAVAYLSQSKYGKYGNPKYLEQNKEIYQNKSDSFTTGLSNGTPPQGFSNIQCEYDDITDRNDGTGSCGGGASTTGNITGIYDMIGGAEEYVMGVLLDNNGRPRSGNTKADSGFNGTLNPASVYDQESYKEDGVEIPLEKYYDAYISFGQNDKGHALSEITSTLNDTGGWYNDTALFLTNNSPWMYRGGKYNQSRGIFSFHSFSGASYAGTGNDGYSTRVVLVESN